MLITCLTNGINLLTGVLINCLTNNSIVSHVQGNKEVVSYLCCRFSISKHLEHKGHRLCWVGYYRYMSLRKKKSCMTISKYM
jgi:hypothetical protein